MMAQVQGAYRLTGMASQVGSTIGTALTFSAVALGVLNT
jgi:hypothetical protein